MKYILGVLLALILNSSVIADPNVIVVSSPSIDPAINISNPLNMTRVELLEIPYSKFVQKFHWAKGKPFKLINAVTKSELPYQLEYRGGDQPVNVLVYIKIAPKASLKLSVKEGKPVAPKAKTFARYVPERYDDFAWENDKVAFRMYGAALESRKDNALGIDVWSKRTPELIVNKWYKSEDYHTDHGEGLDYYSVGNTLGAGDIGLYINDSIVFTNNYKTWKVLDNGPLRSTFQLHYNRKDGKGTPFTVTKTISIDAGSQLNKVEAKFSYQNTAGKTPVAVGIVTRKGKGSILLNEQEGIIGYWEPESLKTGVTGVGCIFTDSVKQMKTDKNHLLSVGNLDNEGTYSYYSGAAWSKAGEILSSGDWFNYLSTFAVRIKKPLIVAF